MEFEHVEIKGLIPIVSLNIGTPSLRLSQVKVMEGGKYIRLKILD
ncbi:MAG: hypothetical protein PHV06_00775 [bacterium]|nr:hypothetical protein [bacterium]